MKVLGDNLKNKRINVCIIDSGLASGFSQIDKKVTERISISYLDDRIEFSKATTDNIGHGTGVAGVLVETFKNVNLTIIKVFHDELKCTAESLLAAMEYALNTDCDIIHMSLGTESQKYEARFKDIIRLAKEKKTLIVCAKANNGIKSYPACMEDVIEVDGSKNIEFGKWIVKKDLKGHKVHTYNGMRRVHWLDGEFTIINGNSFSAPFITGQICKALSVLGSVTYSEAIDWLIKESYVKQVEYDWELLLKQEVESVNNKLSWITKATLVPFNKEIFSLLNFKEFLRFEIQSVVDFRQRGLRGKDTGTLMIQEPNGLTIETDFQVAIEDSDTVIFGHFEIINEIFGRDILIEYLRMAIENRKNIFSLTPLTEPKYEKLLKDADKLGLHVEFPIISKNDVDVFKKFYPAAMKVPVNMPVIGIFGTGPFQGKFSSQVILSKLFEAYGYQVESLGSEPHSRLFGFNEVFPIGYASVNDFDKDYHIRHISYLVKRLALRSPDLIIASSQSGIIPARLSNSPSDNYTLSSIAFLFGLNPDIVILTANPSDDVRIIRNSIIALEAMSGARVPFILVSKVTKSKTSFSFRGSVKREVLSGDEFGLIKKEMKARLGIDVYDIFDKNDQRSILDNLIGILSSSNKMNESYIHDMVANVNVLRELRVGDYARKE